MMRRALAPAVLILASACSDYSLSQGERVAYLGLAAVEVEPSTLDFNTVASGDSEVLSFEVRSVGASLLMVDDFAITGTESAFSLVDPPDAFDLEPGESRTVDVAFTPMSPEGVVGQVTLSTNDPERTRPVVDLVGGGRLPWLAIVPPVYSFDDARVSCPQEVTLILQNIGNDVLIIDDLDYDSDGQLTLEHGLELPLSLDPGAYVTVDIDLVPAAVGETEGLLLASSNDPRGVVEAVQSADPDDEGATTDTFQVPVDPPVDILFAVDQSCSMEDDAENLSENFSAFVSTLADTTSGWQVGVVTLDDGCVNGGVLDVDTTDLESTFAAAVALGDDETVEDDEALLKMTDAALRQTGAGDCNAGLLRDDAPTHVIVVTDEPERSVERASAWTWEYWLARLEGYAPGSLQISGVVDLDDCNEGAEGYVEAIEATGGELLSICTGEWSDRVEALAAVTLQLVHTFALSGTPDPSTLVVTIDGVVVDGWSYDAVADAVVFENGLPEGGPGSQVEVVWSKPGTCP